MRRMLLGVAAAVTLSTAAAGHADASWLSHLFAPCRPPQPAYVVVTPPPCGNVGHHGHGDWRSPRVAPQPRPQTFQSGYRGYGGAYYGGMRY